MKKMGEVVLSKLIQNAVIIMVFSSSAYAGDGRKAVVEAVTRQKRVNAALTIQGAYRAWWLEKQRNHPSVKAFSENPDLMKSFASFLDEATLDSLKFANKRISVHIL